MRFLSMSLAVVAALLIVTACTGKNSNDQTNATASSAAETTSAAATTAPGAATTTAAAAATTAAAAGEPPAYPGAVTQASGSTSNMGQSATGSVMTTDDSFDKVYAWYQQNMPAGSEKSHVTTPIESAVFTIGEPGKGQTSLTITTSGGKTMITTAHVKM